MAEMPKAKDDEKNTNNNSIVNSASIVLP